MQVPPETPISPPPPVVPTQVTPSQPKVRKPFLLALAAAVVISGLIVALPKLFPGKPPTLPTPIAQVAATPPTQVLPLTLTLTSPKDGELAIDQEIVVEGQTSPNTTVVIFSETDEVTTESDASGKFSTTITLSTGINTLTISAFSDNGEEKSVSVDIVYDS